MHTHVFDTPAGFCGIAWTASGVSGFCLPVPDAAAAERALRRRAPGAIPSAPPDGIARVIAAVRCHFAGEPQDFTRVPLDLPAPEPFFAEVYALVRGLRWGETTTYGAIARRLGAGPEAARDVGRAMGANPVPLLVPCHRVLAAGGKLGGFSAPGGAQTKRRMLALEGALPDPAPGQGAFAF